mgnify:CR=1 FL=1
MGFESVLYVMPATRLIAIDFPPEVRLISNPLIR